MIGSANDEIMLGTGADTVNAFPVDEVVELGSGANETVYGGTGDTIEAAGGAALGTGDVTILGRDVIHSVVNPLAKISGAIHVYDGDFFAVQRSMWDAETLAEEPYDLNAVSSGTAISRPR